MPSSTDNELILIGGRIEGVAEYLASKSDGEVGIVTLAQIEHSSEYLEEKRQLFDRYGCKLRHVKSSEDLDGLSLVLYAGGDQLVLAKRLKETGLHAELVKWWRQGEVILAGSSAGSMVLCGVMLEESGDQEFGRVGVGLTHGLGPIGSSFIVPHWSQWTTQAWREELVRQHSAYYIFGIDEGTALVWRAGRCKVIGSGKVYARGRMEGEWSAGQEFAVARGFEGSRA